MNLPKNNKHIFLFRVLLTLNIGMALILTGVLFRDYIISKFFSKETSAPLVKSAITTPFVSTSGTKLYLQGLPYQFAGFNAYSLATLWGTNAGCGGQVNDVDGFFSSLRPNSVVRMWAFQGSMATNVYTKQIDWTALDRVVNSAEIHGQKLILTLAGQAGTCDDGHWKDRAWYSGGYNQAFNDNGSGLTPLPYLQYIKLVVERYKNSTAVVMWEPVSEPESSDCPAGYTGDGCYGHQTCTDEKASSDALRSFFDIVGGQIKSIDSNHLIESGVIGDGQCGAVFEDYSYIHQSLGVDVASYHDYGRDNQPMPGDQWNGLQKRLDQMKIINKPLIVGEVGMLAMDNSTNCISYLSRRDKMKAKMDVQFPAGISGFVPWDLTGGISKICNFDIVDGDPILPLLYNYPLSMGITATPSPIPLNTLTPTPPISASPTPTSAPSATPSPTKSVDTLPPSPPTSLAATAVSSSQINLIWNPSMDNIGVTGYNIYRDNIYVASTSGTTYGDTNLTASTSYTYYVKAKDASGNLSTNSNIQTISTLAVQVLNGIVSGIVSSTPGVVASGVKVVINLNGTSLTAYTNSLGFYTFTNLPAGKYSIVFTAKKYPKQTVFINILNGQTTTLNILLSAKK